MKDLGFKYFKDKSFDTLEQKFGHLSYNMNFSTVYNIKIKLFILIYLCFIGV